MRFFRKIAHHMCRVLQVGVARSSGDKLRTQSEVVKMKPLSAPTTSERAEALTQNKSDTATEHVDVLVVGAGISGIGGAYHLATQLPGKRFVVLESKDTFGGTWVTHKYPGIRSDSDLYTFGYRFKPWTSAPIATAQEILKYMGAVIEENKLDEHLRYNHKISSAEWSSETRQWIITATDTTTGSTRLFTAGFLWMCQGYYRHEVGYTPDWRGADRFNGQIVHPQTWPEDLDYEGKNVVVIGSGATAATLVPAIATECGHVTMLQRSPTYFATGRNSNELADMLRQLDIPEEWTHTIVRKKVLHDSALIAKRCFDEPDIMKTELLAGVRAYLPDDVVDQHFTPRYRPWQQRLAFIPDADLFKAVQGGKASVVTDEIETFTETGILLKSGAELHADIIVTATGFDLNVLGDIEFTVDGRPLNFHDTVTYRGMMFTDVPNMMWVFGYFRSSWTLRADLLGDFICRLLSHMDEKGASVVTPALTLEEQTGERFPWMDADNFNPGYLKRGMHLLPKQLDHAPWQTSQDYQRDAIELPLVDLDDGTLAYE